MPQIKLVLSNLKFAVSKHQTYLKCISLISFAASSTIFLLSFKWSMSGKLLQMTLFFFYTEVTDRAMMTYQTKSIMSIPLCKAVPD